MKFDLGGSVDVVIVALSLIESMFIVAHIGVVGERLMTDAAFIDLNPISPFTNPANRDNPLTFDIAAYDISIF